jgi:hypothetical protein
VELCPETGICSILKEYTGKVDLMPDEVVALRAAKDDVAKIKGEIGKVDIRFSGQLTSGNLLEIAGALGA